MTTINVKLHHAVENFLFLNDFDPEENPEYWRGGYELLADMIPDPEPETRRAHLDQLIQDISRKNGRHREQTNELVSINNFNGLRVEYTRNDSSVLFSSHHDSDAVKCVALLDFAAVENLIQQMRELVTDIRAGEKENEYGHFSNGIGSLLFDYSTDTPDDIEFCTSDTSVDDKRNVYLSTAMVLTMCEVLRAIVDGANIDSTLD